MKRHLTIAIITLALHIVAVRVQNMFGLHQAHDPLVPHRIPGFVLMSAKP